MKDLLETLQGLQHTPVPNLLVIGGVIFLFLAFVGRFGAFVQLPRQRQKWAGIIGAVLLVFGVGLSVAVPASPSATATAPPSAGISAPSILTVQIWDVVADQKNKLIASERFDISGSDETLQEVGQWVTKQLTQAYDLTASQIRVHVYVPADLSAEKLDIQMVPPIPFQVYFSVVEAGVKSRVPVAVESDQVLASLDRDFDLEIYPVGFAVQTVHVTWGEQVDEDLVLEPREVAIAVEEMSGEHNSYGTLLANALASQPRFAIKDPSSLKQLRDTIATKQAFIAANPQVQSGYRTTLGVDVIITGTLERP